MSLWAFILYIYVENFSWEMITILLKAIFKNLSFRKMKTQIFVL